MGSGERFLFSTTLKCVKSHAARTYNLSALCATHGTKGRHPHTCLGSAVDACSTGATRGSEWVRLIGEAGGCTVLELNRAPRVAVATPSDRNAVRPGCDVDLDVPASGKKDYSLF